MSKSIKFLKQVKQSFYMKSSAIMRSLSFKKRKVQRKIAHLNNKYFSKTPVIAGPKITSESITDKFLRDLKGIAAW